MAVQLSVAVRNAKLDAIEAETGTLAVLKLFSGPQPANCAAANSGVELWSETVPSDWMAAASGGTKALTGTWQAAAIAAGTAAHFRKYKSDGSTCVMQGSVGIGTGDLQLDNTNLAIGQSVTITAFTWTEGNA